MPRLMPNRELAAKIERRCQLDPDAAERVADYIESGDFLDEALDYETWAEIGARYEWFGE